MLGTLFVLGSSAFLACSDMPSQNAAAPSDEPKETAEPAEGTPEAEPSLLLPSFDPRAKAVERSSDGPTELSLGYFPAPVTIPDLAQDRVPVVMAPILPARFDLRTARKLNAVRNQGSCGSCWAFASLASGESGLLPGETWNFSEEHVNLSHGFDVAPCDGGNAFMSMAYMTRGSGPVAESDIPYTGTVRPLGSSPSPKKYLKEGLVLPDRTSATDNDTLKSAIMTYGALYTTMRWTSAAFRTQTHAFYDAGPRQTANHAVDLVGWDDAFPAQSFVPGAPQNGAFLVRNSWGTGFGQQGYFWVSYHDAYIGRSNVAFASFGAPTEYDRIYGYDKLGQTTALSYGTRQSFGASVITAAGPGLLQSVGFYTAARSATVTISVYEGTTTGPTTGTKLGTRQVDEPWAGYHTATLAGISAPLVKGRKYGIVIGVTYPQAPSYVPLEYPFSGYSSKVVAVPGTSFVSSNGSSWTDAAVVWRANTPIKTFVRTILDCDDKNACTVDLWDGTKCLHTTARAGTSCRAATGPCDVAEACTGASTTCPRDQLLAKGRACAVNRTCNGTTKTCP